MLHSSESMPTHKLNFDRIVTLLFLACSKSKWPEYTIKRIDSLRLLLKKKEIQMNHIHYCSMIQAYGRAGAIFEAFNAVDEMNTIGLKPNVDVLNNLLCCCIEQKNEGFHLALKVWQTFLKREVKPNLDSFNLLLRAARDCTIRKVRKRTELGGDEMKNQQQAQQRQQVESSTKSTSVEQESTKESSIAEKLKDDEMKMAYEKDLSEQSEPIQLTTDQVEIVDENKLMADAIEEQIKKLEWWQSIRTHIDKKELAKDLAKTSPRLNEFLTSASNSVLVISDDKDTVDLDEIIKTKNSSPIEGSFSRLAVIGGIDGVLNAMQHFGIRPNYKTFNLLVVRSSQPLYLQIIYSNLIYISNLIFVVGYILVFAKEYGRRE